MQNLICGDDAAKGPTKLTMVGKGSIAAGMLLQMNPRNLQWRSCCCREAQGTYSGGLEAADMAKKNDAADRPKELNSGGHDVADRPTENDAADRPKELRVAGMSLQTDQ